MSACLDEQTPLPVAVVCAVVCKGLWCADATIRVVQPSFAIAVVCETVLLSAARPSRLHVSAASAWVGGRFLVHCVLLCTWVGGVGGSRVSHDAVGLLLTLRAAEEGCDRNLACLQVAAGK